MAKIFYIEDANGEYFSTDKTRRFKALQGKELHEYLKTPEGRSKRFYIEDGIGVEVPGEAQKSFRVYERRKQYVNDIMKKYKYTVMSLSSDVLGYDDCSGEDAVPDTDINIEDTVIKNVMFEKLRTALTYLSDDERELISQLIFTDTPASQRDLSSQTGIPQKTIDNRKSVILRKLKKYLEN